MRIVWRSAAPIEFKEAVIISVGDGAESAKLTIHVFFYCNEPCHIVITPELAQLRQPGDLGVLRRVAEGVAEEARTRGFASLTLVRFAFINQ